MVVGRLHSSCGAIKVSASGVRNDVKHIGQVVDFWAFSEEEWGKEIMSMHHTRNALQKSTPQVFTKASTLLTRILSSIVEIQAAMLMAA